MEKVVFKNKEELECVTYDDETNNEFHIFFENMDFMDVLPLFKDDNFKKIIHIQEEKETEKSFTEVARTAILPNEKGKSNITVVLKK